LIAPLALLAGCGDNAEPASEDSNIELGGQENSPISATADLIDVDGGSIGQAMIVESQGNLTLKLTASGLTEGLHGVHVHQTGLCDSPDFKSAGGHWNPRDTSHGLENPKGSHGGDLPNILIGSDGTGELSHDLGEGSLSDSKFALLDADGAAFIVHAGEDDQKSDPSGNSGARVACGVFVSDS